VLEDGLRRRGTKDDGDDAAGASAARAGEDVRLERPLEEFGPGDGAAGRAGGPAQAPPGRKREATGRYEVLRLGSFAHELRNQIHLALLSLDALRSGRVGVGGAPDLFRAFGDRRKSDRSGLGLGLSISRQAVVAHGGEIRAQNLPGKGCIFTIDLPTAAA
jgi:hypothetical protein